MIVNNLPLYTSVPLSVSCGEEIFFQKEGFFLTKWIYARKESSL